MKQFRNIFVGLCVVTCWGLTAVAPLSAQSGDLAYQRFVLSNGLTVVVHEDHKAPVVAINVTYHVGSADEVAGRDGFAHLFEHLMYGGSQNVPSQFLNALTSVGATGINGSTSFDRTNFFETVPDSSLEYALFAESDRMGHLNVTQATLDLQRGVVENELRQREGAPYGKAWPMLSKSTYPAAHPYAHQPLGSIEDLNAASLSDVKSWLQTHYGPSNATLTLAGDITAEKAHALVEKYFGAIPAGPPVAHQDTWVAKMSGTQMGEMQDRVSQPLLMFVWNIPGFSTAESDYIDMVGDVLTQGKNSRLYKKLVYDRQIATGVEAGLNPLVLSGQFIISVTVKKGADVEAVRTMVHDTLAEFIAQGPTSDELDRIKAINRREILSGLESVGQQASALADGQVYKNNPGSFEISIARQRASTPQDLQKAASTWLSDGVYELTVDPYPNYRESGKDVDRSKAPVVGTTPPIKLPALETTTLSNGLKVVLAERHEVPLITLSLSVKAGFSADHLSTPGTARLTSSLLNGGTAAHSALEISDMTEKLGAQFSAQASVDDNAASMQMLAENLDPSLDLFADMVVHPSFPEEDFLREQKLQLAAIQQEADSPINEAIRVLPPLLFGKVHPYGQPLSGTGTSQGVSKLTRSDILKFHERWFKPNNATLLVVGDTTLAQLRPKLERAFGAWKPGKVPENNKPDISHPAEPGVYLIDRPGTAQSVIFAGTIGPRAYEKDDDALNLWNSVLGSFGGRLNMDLRETKHWTYGASTLFVGTEHQRPFIVYAPVQTDKTKDSLIEINRQLHDVVGDHPPALPEVQDQIQKKVRSLPGSLESMNSVLHAVGQIEEFNLPHDYYATLTSRLLAVQPGEVASAGRSFLHPDDLVWVIIGDRSKIEEDVRGLNLGVFHLVPNDATEKQ